jgi:GcrA cell cycle regulator
MNAWTIDKLKIAAERWKEGDSANTIARIVGVSRNAVIGVAHRRRDLFPERLPPESTKNYVMARRIEKTRRDAEAARAEEQPWAPPKRAEYIPGLDALTAPSDDCHGPGNPVQLMLLTSTTCRWPVSGQGAATLFCGSGIDRDRIYCDAHRRLAYQPRPR